MNKLIVTTSWDDGAVEDLRLAELLKKYDLKGTFYIAKQYSRMGLKPRDIRLLAQEFEIGSHTLTHPILTNIPVREAENEIKFSKTYLEDLIGDNIKMLSYPYGRYNTTIKRIVQSSGYIGARTTIPGYIDFPNDPFEWKVTQYAAFDSPIINYRVNRQYAIPLKTLFNWEIRAKLLFDLAVANGGVYHLWGHSWQIVEGRELGKLERVFAYISRKTSVIYECNFSIFKSQDLSKGKNENSLCG